VGETFREGENCPSMVVVPPGRYQMGSPPEENGRFDNEGPRHEVVIDYCFAVAKYPVTRGQWRYYLRDTGRKGIYNWEHPGFPQDDSHPVVCTTWDEATAYAVWLSRRTGYPYRLLTEAEHEYVNRAGGTGAYFWGDTDVDLHRYANGADRASQARSRSTTPVGSFLPNMLGLHDTTGNVWCWTQDHYNDSYRSVPTDGSACTAGTGKLRVARGGSWDADPRSLRAASRVRFLASDASNNLGFRVVRTNFLMR
jgi:formylglycine-generating enzyme required for sulfatase activity